MTETNTPQEKHIAEEIRELEQALQAKRRALLEQGEVKEDKELFRETFQEKYQEELQAPTPGGSPREGAVSVSGHTPPAARAKDEDEIQSLIQFAFTHGVASAIARAKKESPWLLDELHDRLIDEYYQKLVQAKLVNP